MLVTRPSGKRPYIVRALPAPRADRFLAGESIACVIHLHDLVAEPSKASLCAVFGLTEREADLAIEVVCCAGLTNAAANAMAAPNTARKHLQGKFAPKSGVTNQTEMVSPSQAALRRVGFGMDLEDRLARAARRTLSRPCRTRFRASARPPC